MSVKKYAFIKDGIVEDCILIEDDKLDMLDSIKESKGSDLYIDYTDIPHVAVKCHYIDGVFYPPRQYDNWILIDGNWHPPVPRPVEEGKTFMWRQEKHAWEEIKPLEIPTVE